MRGSKRLLLDAGYNMSLARTLSSKFLVDPGRLEEKRFLFCLRYRCGYLWAQPAPDWMPAPSFITTS